MTSATSVESHCPSDGQMVQGASGNPRLLDEFGFYGNFSQQLRSEGCRLCPSVVLFGVNCCRNDRCSFLQEIQTKMIPQSISRQGEVPPVNLGLNKVLGTIYVCSKSTKWIQFRLLITPAKKSCSARGSVSGTKCRLHTFLSLPVCIFTPCSSTVRNLTCNNKYLFQILPYLNSG